jgi:hypothetical protein
MVKLLTKLDRERSERGIYENAKLAMHAERAVLVRSKEKEGIT